MGASYGASKTVKLNVAGAFHSEYMRPALEQLRVTLEGVVFHAPRIAVIMNVDGLPESDPQAMKRKLLDQLVMPVLWERRYRVADSMMLFDTDLVRALSIVHCLAHFSPLAHAVEVGPGNVLTGLMRRILKDSSVTPKPSPKAMNL